ncbi:hypothetical protein HOP50_03g25810 [Chloropicon primus]|uniref:GYF domain-containing protein n=2 Tax=Chloropicon primus TaxID=1764295 RepID=A0A5B8ML16_9CHLO|nr:hypothetical protein A3770_03p25800 [Chloropicon primus]UPQ99274.1 hypothetical protein HOP50_03g25810 [Chloropicon primus]|eukprot:QDZ20062.1 hypothetical protein A3770_03p25800 [Chloropicon primus]
MGLALSLGGLGRFNPGQDPKMGDMQVLAFEDKEASVDQDYFDATRGYPWPGSVPDAVLASPEGLEHPRKDMWDKSVYPPRRRAPWERKRPKLTHYERMLYNSIISISWQNVWYYRDRMNVPRGPCQLPVLRQAWTNGLVDENTLVWGQGLLDWIPAKNVTTLVAQVRTPEVRLATWLKKKMAIEPQYRRVRKQREKERNHTSSQVKKMF